MATKETTGPKGAGYTSGVGKDFEKFSYSVPLSDVSRQCRHVSNIDGVCYLDPLDEVVVLEQRSGTIKIYDAEKCTVKKTVSLKRGAPMAAEYVDDYKGMMMCFGDRTMGLWNFAPGKRQYQIKLAPDGQTPLCWPSSQVQLSLQWLSQHRRLYSGSVDGVISVWNVDERKSIQEMRTRTDSHGHTTPGHTDMVMDLHHLGSLDTIASASLDTKICIWDLYTHQCQQELKGHRLGVVSLSYCPAQRLLASAGFDHDAFVWSPFSNTVVSKLKGHNSSLVKVCRMGDESSTELLTADSDGVFKIWDIRNFRCIQTFEGNFKKMLAYTYVPPRKTRVVEMGLPRIVERMARIFAASKTFVHVFERDAPPGAGVMNLADDKPASAVVFNEPKRTILTVHASSVKVWAATNGTLKREFRDLAESAITAICIDSDGQNFIIGEHAGHIKVYDCSTGLLVKSFYSQPTEIAALLYCHSERTVVSTDWRGNIVVHDDCTEEGGADAVILTMDPKRLCNHKDDVTTAAYAPPPLSLVATGAADSTVRLWMALDGKLEGVLKHGEHLRPHVQPPPGSETYHSHTTCLCFLTPFPFLVAADSLGYIELWGLPTSGHNHQRRLRFNLPQPDLSALAAAAVSFKWDAATRRLCIGDEYGGLRCLDLQPALAALGCSQAAAPPVVLAAAAATTGDPATAAPPAAPATPRRAAGVLQNPPVLWKTIKAHSDSISGMSFLQTATPPALLTASFDCTVALWRWDDGSMLATLRQGLPHPSWRLKFKRRPAAKPVALAAQRRNSSTPAAEGDANHTLGLGDFLGGKGPEVTDLKTKFPKIMPMRKGSRKKSGGRRRRTRGAFKYSGSLPELKNTSQKMAQQDLPDDAFTLKQTFQRMIWEALKTDNMENLNKIIEEADQAGFKSIARVARKLHTQSTL